MKRICAAGVLAALTVLTVVLTCLVPKGGALTGSWETGVKFEAEKTAVLRYTFCDDGTYTCAVASDRAGLADSALQVQGNYLVRGNKLYLSEGLDYRIDPKVCDIYRLEGDTLTLLENSADAAGLYPLTLTRVAEG